MCTGLQKVTRVTSLPGRLTSALPRGTRYSPSGTSPFQPYMHLRFEEDTGLSSRMAVLRSPLASAGVAGATTLRPGMWAIDGLQGLRVLRREVFGRAVGAAEDDGHA